ncbi:MAG: LamG-like jellyroll fold domain-containing protein [Verrucomicrobiales bacterium]
MIWETVTEALDASSNGNNGTVNGDTIVAGPSGLDGDFAIDFDGIDDSVTTEGSIMNDIDEFTMSGWVRFEEQPGNRVGLFGQNDAVEYGMINPTTMQHWSAAGGAFDVPFGPVIEEWTSIVLVNTPEQRILYVDGEEVASGGGTNPANSGFSFNIGGDGVYDDAGNFFTGQMDDVAVWGRALTPEEAKQVYETRAIISPDFIDTDGDGMPDGYETNNGLNPFDAADKDTDLDGDTVSNFAEFTNRTNPNDKDTDKDGLEDGVETGTGVWVSAENTGTLPTKVDSDKDGLLDGVETNTGTFVSASDTGTDPNKEDSDGDTFGDSQEIVAGSDPTDPNSKPEGGLLAAWDFEDSADDSVAVDVVNGIEAINDGAVYADDPVRGSVIDFEGAAGTLHVDDASFLSLAAATDQMTFVFWQLNADTVSSSTFWAVSPSSSGGSRGAQAHVPWDAAGNIYFDTVGCCDGNQRGTFTAGVDFLDGEWHHYAFVKDGEDKRVYIDGALEYEIVNTSPLPDDFTELWIGSAPNNTSIVQAKLDDFGVYSIALTEEQINEVKDNGLGGGTGVPFQIIEVKRISATNAEVTWQSKEGRSYTMEHTGGFVDWIEVSDGLESNGETTTFEDSTLTSEVEERYYRVREE